MKEEIPFEWRGMNHLGEKTNGMIHASNPHAAKAFLRKQGIVVRSLRKKRRPLLEGFQSKISSSTVSLFSRQMAGMLQAGIPLIQSLDIVTKGLTNLRMKQIVITIKKDLESGLSLSSALSKFPIYFNELYCRLVDAGEKSGTLDVMLDKIAHYKEKIETVKKKVKKALTYPTAVLIISFFVTTALLMFVVPQFELLFNSFGADLPVMTRGIITLSEGIQSYWYILIGLLGTLAYGVLYGKRHSATVSYQLDRFLLKIPMIGSILMKSSIARLTRTLAIMFSAGLPLIEALQTASGVTGNLLYTHATKAMCQDVSNGLSLRVSMQNTQRFPDLVIQMIAIGEESGTLENMLSKAADYYEDEVNHAVDTLTTLLEPIIMTILGVLVGSLVVAMYLPMFKLGSVV
jgi:type IV pilus assembly protein PilC